MIVIIGFRDFTIYLWFFEFEFPAISFSNSYGTSDREWRYRIYIVYSCMFEISRMKEGMILKMKVWSYKNRIFAYWNKL